MLAPITAFDPSGFASQHAAAVPEFKARDYVPKSYRKAVKVMARDIQLAVVAAAEAVQRAAVVTKPMLDGADAEPTFAPQRVGCQIGAGLIAADLDELNSAIVTAASEGAFSYTEWGETGLHNLTPLWMLKYLPNMLACHVTIVHDARGPSNTITCAEASGLLSLGESMRVIEREDADAAFSGGAESKLNHLALVRMEMIGAAAPVSAEDDPLDVLLPFDSGSRGSLVGEAGGILIVEAAGVAAERGAPVIARLCGFGAGHTPAGDDLDRRADGLVIAVENALRDAELGPDDIDAAVVAGSGIPRSDESEAHALRRVFGERTERVELVLLATAIGNAMAGQGGVATAVAARALHEQHLPARINRGTPPSDLRAEAAAAREADLRHVLVCTPSAGGQNAAVILGRS
jgi:3-oxoacyl-[acyl-carrier-protein] synthase II